MARPRASSNGSDRFRAGDKKYESDGAAISYALTLATRWTRDDAIFVSDTTSDEAIAVVERKGATITVRRLKAVTS